MTEPYIGEIRMWACTFAPRNWANCDGGTMQIDQNPALFSLLSTIYGGDGRNTFGLPNLKGRASLHQGHGSGLTNRPIGQVGGAETVTLTTSEIPSHTHQMRAEEQAGTTGVPTDNVPAELPAGVNAYSADSSLTMNTAAIGNTGGQGHENMMPFLTVRFCIATNGIFPSQS